VISLLPQMKKKRENPTDKEKEKKCVMKKILI